MQEVNIFAASERRWGQLNTGEASELCQAERFSLRDCFGFFFTHHNETFDSQLIEQ
jgi:hypothetical protein